jgi:tetratricopeptide (TPR) repeat protein
VRREPPRLVDWLASLLLLGGIAVSAAPRAAEAPVLTTVRDLYYGEVLFQFYKRDDFTALTHLLAARDARRVPHHDAESELLLGGLYLSYGQHRQASEIFERLLADNPSPPVRDRAWFYLGKIRYQRGLHDEALASFARVGGNLPEALSAELPMLVSQSWMAKGDFDQAQRVLATWDAPGAWLAYAQFNLGVALVRLDRVAEGAALLERVGTMEAPTPEQKSLRDKANLALGYAWLQANDAARARPVLQRVRLRGPAASKALLGAGWADAIAGDYRSALVPWLELIERDLLDSAVQESFLAVPYALGRLDAHGPAVERYQRALGAFDAEITHLDAAIERARGGTLVPALLAGDDDELSRWYWQLSAVPDNDDSRYLYHLLAGHDFQEGIKNYRDLAALADNLEHWRVSVDSFADMVAARVSAHEERAPRAGQRAGEIDLGALAGRRDALAARIASAEQSRDLVALASAEQRSQWRRLESLEQDPAFGSPANAGLRERQRVLKGVLAWDLDRKFKERLWRTKRALADADAVMSQAGSRLSSIQGAQQLEPRRFDQFASRIAALSPRIEAMRSAIGRTLQRQEGALVAMAVSELESRKERLASYRVQARFALATMYDRANSAQVAASGAPGAEP